MELLGEEVHAKVAVLAGLRRGGDADDLARAALKDQEVANADVVARDGDSVGSHCGSWGGRTGGRCLVLLGVVAGSGRTDAANRDGRAARGLWSSGG